MKHSCKILLLLITSAILPACGGTRVDQQSTMPPVPLPPLASRPTSGSIYAAGTDIRLFEDRKANRVGDILTVRLEEQTNATKNSETSTEKSTEATLANPTVLGRALSNGGIPLFDGNLSGDQSFDGRGTSSQSNSLAGDITVTVVERLANGNLRISGEKWVTLNQGKEFIRLSGIIRPDDIEPDNSLVSTRIASAQITYSSKGVLAAANKMGPIARFFNSVLHPF